MPPLAGQRNTGPAGNDKIPTEKDLRRFCGRFSSVFRFLIATTSSIQPLLKDRVNQRPFRWPIGQDHRYPPSGIEVYGVRKRVKELDLYLGLGAARPRREGGGAGRARRDFILKKNRRMRRRPASI